MSTNPFRRSSLKDPGGSLNRHTSDFAGRSAGPLSVDTRVSNPSQKHVNFASPPAIPISPASFPPSPESSRYSPGIDARHLLPAPTNYSEALQNDPFEEELDDDDDEDGPIEEAIQNAKTNTAQATIPISSLSRSKVDAVRNTLSRFSAAPKRNSTRTTPDPKQEMGRPQKPLMDVDAFKRLLLTGESGTSTPNGGKSQPVQPTNAPAISESSSTADTASISQRSIFEMTSTAVDESPRSSYELDVDDAEIQRQRTVAATAHEPRRKPPPPKTRHGKSINDSLSASAPSVSNATSSRPGTTSQTGEHTYSRQPSSENRAELKTTPTESKVFTEAADPDSTRKQPPAPPLSRRQSHNRVPKPSLSRSSSMHQSSTGPSRDAFDLESTSSNLKTPPPLPPLRRPFSSEKTTELHLPSTSEEPGASDSLPSDLPDQVNLAARNSDQYSSTKRISQAVMGPPPPLPPPRRNRGSSRSSVDGQRPSSYVLGSSPFSTNQNEVLRPDTGNRSPSGGPSAIEIIANLAALQKEVDEARSRGVNG